MLETLNWKSKCYLLFQGLDFCGFSVKAVNGEEMNSERRFFVRDNRQSTSIFYSSPSLSMLVFLGGTVNYSFVFREVAFLLVPFLCVFHNEKTRYGAFETILGSVGAIFCKNQMFFEPLGEYCPNKWVSCKRAVKAGAKRKGPLSLKARNYHFHSVHIATLIFKSETWGITPLFTFMACAVFFYFNFFFLSDARCRTRGTYH